MAFEEATASYTPVDLQDVKRLRRDIRRYLWMHGRPPLEQSTSPDELHYLMTTVQRTGARRVAEIGFNAGYSSYAFLRAAPHTQVVAFDLGEHAYSRTAKRLIDKRFPGRHTLVFGDSTKTVPQYHADNPDARFDLVFIDGGHSYEVAKADIVNMGSLCTDQTAVIIDDLTPWRRWGVGPTKAWTEAVDEGLVRQEELFKDGREVDTIEHPGSRSWALGRYVM